MSAEPDELATRPFAYTSADLRSLNLRALRWWNVLTPLLALSLLGWLFGSMMISEGSLSWPLVACLFIVALGTTAPLTWQPLVAFRSMRRQGLLVSQVVSIQPEVLLIRSERGEFRPRWSAINRVVGSRNRLFIFASRSVAYIVPRRAFDTEAEFDRFADAANERWHASHAS